MHIYAFGSVCRGEVTLGSDVDLLVCIEEDSRDFDPEQYSIYSYDRLKKLWEEGSPFAWHLFKESKLIYSSDSLDFIRSLGAPNDYVKIKDDCEKFYKLFLDSKHAIEKNKNSSIFNLSSIFLSIRNIATCYSINKRNYIFSRSSAFLVKPKLNIPFEIYLLLERARILATRGHGEIISEKQVHLVKKHFIEIDSWMKDILCKVDKNE